MNSLIRYEPFKELMSLREAMDRLFEDSFVTPSLFRGVRALGTLPIDMYQTENEVIVKTALPGVKPEEVNITIGGNTLTIKGETEAKEEVKKKDYLCQECHYSAFSRTVALPAGLKTDKAEASFEDGILTLTIPKAEEAKPKQIKIKATKTTEEKK